MQDPVVPPPQPEHVFVTNYDDLGQIANRQYPTGQIVWWDRNERGFLEQMCPDEACTEQFVTGIGWDEQSRPVVWRAGNDVFTITSLDPASGRLDWKLHLDAELYKIAYYNFDSGDRLTSIEDEVGTSTFDFHYDKLNRLTHARLAPPGNPIADLYYGYDNIGNLTCMGASSSDVTSCPDGTKFTYPGGGADRPHAPTHMNAAAVYYDDGGNLTGSDGGDWAFQYTKAGEVSWAYDAPLGLLGYFFYDATGRRARMELLGSGNTYTHHLLTPDFEWDESDAVGRILVRLEGRIVAVYKELYLPPCPGCAVVVPGIGKARGNSILWLLLPGLVALAALPLSLRLGAWLRERPRGGRLRPVVAVGTCTAFVFAVVVPFPLVHFLVQEVHATSPANVLYYHADHLGSSVLVTAADGSVVKENVLYRPYGEYMGVAGDPAPDYEPPEFGFTGQRSISDAVHDLFSRYYDYGARWYFPAIGHFLQPDPIIANPFSPQNLNRYSYVANDPVNRVDPTGLQALTAQELGWETAASSWRLEYGDAIPGPVQPPPVVFSPDTAAFTLGDVAMRSARPSITGNITSPAPAVSQGGQFPLLAGGGPVPEAQALQQAQAQQKGFSFGILGGGSFVSVTGFDVAGFAGAEFGSRGVTDFRKLDAVATFSHPGQNVGIELDLDVGFAFLPAKINEFGDLVITDLNLPTTFISIKAIFNPARPEEFGIAIGFGPGIGGSVVFDSRSTQ